MGEWTWDLGGDLQVRRLGFGTVRLTGRGVWGPPDDVPAAKALLRSVASEGVNLFDTASSYGPSVVEELIAEALHPYPPEIVIATKVGLRAAGPGTFEVNGRPEWLRKSCHDSLTRLRLDRIDLLQLHAVDPEVPIEESVGAFKDLQDEGLIRHIGLSNVTEELLIRAESVVDVVSVQNCYNVADRIYEGVVDACNARSIAFISWFPLARGKLANSTELLDLARDLGATPSQIAIAWLLQRSPTILPIPGTSSYHHFQSNLRAENIHLDNHTRDRLDDLHRRIGPLVIDAQR